jgi:MOSC domain-containing protein YiiM
VQIISVNVGKRRQLSGRSFNGETGIFKEPVAAPVRVGELGLESDAIVNTRHHGGKDQAVYIYREEDYAWWSERLGRAVGPGTYGDNLTLTGLPGPGLAIGTRLSFGDVELEITAPRIPCNTLATRMGDPGFLKAFVQAERPGLYCRVIRAGSLAQGETFELDDAHASTVTTIDVFRASYRKPTRQELELFLSAPIDLRTRADFEEQLEAYGT